jgi:DhnA family fructose-bisphosphate aldolase class Ia
MTSSTATGKDRRLRRLFTNASGKIILVPLDDSLLAGPTLGLERMGEKLALIVENPPDAIVGFKGLFLNNSSLLRKVPGILNVTASTTRSQHTRKCLIASVEEAVQLGLDAVAVHVNITSKYESEMIGMLGVMSRQCEALGMPLLAHMYVRTEKNDADDNHERLKRQKPDAYAKLIAHAGRIGLEAGADFIKTQYSGHTDSFRLVVEACAPVPVVVAGGPPVGPIEMLRLAYGAIGAGAAGISFGRNVFSRPDPRPFISALKMIVHEGATPQLALQRNHQMVEMKET